MAVPALALSLTPAGIAVASLTAAGLLVGWTWGPLARSSSLAGRIGVIGAVAVSATVLGAACIALTLVSRDLVTHASPPTDTGADAVSTFLGYGTHGLSLLGIPSLLLTIPLATLWRWLVAQGPGVGADDDPTPRQVRDAPPDPQRLGGRLGAGVGAAGAVTALVILGLSWLGTADDATLVGQDARFYVETGLWTTAFVALVALGGGIVGRRFGPRAVTETDAPSMRFIIEVAWSATLVGAFLIALPMAIGWTVEAVVTSSGPWALVAFPLGLFAAVAMGLVCFGLPSLLATVPAAYVWLILLRRQVDRKAA